ncbi:MAG: protein TolQ [Gammaproteobacteria bacterium]|nr:protein TolQ [Gammaproteobacteria bacterium]MBI5617148.1 protein TolQ [Gammaproteobacteria bacterium]
MEADLSIANLILGASLLVKFVMLILLSASIASWTLVFTKNREIKSAKRAAQSFEDQFWSSEDLTALFNRITQKRGSADAMQRMFEAGFKEFARLRKREGIDPAMVLEGSQRAMKIALSRELEELEANLPLLATVGSVSPYIGLFGTVWGIMNSFRGLSNMHQATLAMVAPGISEALVATAMGLFAAIPAVVAYNRFASEIDRIASRYEIFMDEFSAILQRQVHT